MQIFKNMMKYLNLIQTVGYYFTSFTVCLAILKKL